MSPERLQKVLASAGIASRRDCEALIAAGRVMVNGRVVTVPGTRVDLEHDEVLVDGQPLRMPAKRTYIMLHKPAGVVSTAEDTHGRPTVVDLVDVPARVFPVGRLDLDSEGLILLTDDGELAHALTHPSFEVEKEYRVLLDRALTPEALRSWRNGVLLDGEMTAPAWVELIGTAPEGVWVRIVLREGRKRQIRAVAKLLGYEVLRLIRVREGELELGDLPPRAWRYLTDEEVAALRAHIPTRRSLPERSSEFGPAARRGSGSAEAGRESPVASERAPFAPRGERSVPRVRGEERPPRSRSEERGPGRWSEERPPRSRSEERGPGRWSEERPPRSRSEERGPGRWSEERPPRSRSEERGPGRWSEERPPRSRSEERGPGRWSEERPPRSRSEERGPGRWSEERPPRSRSEERGPGRWSEERPPRSRSEERGPGRWSEERPPRSRSEERGPGRWSEERPPRSWSEERGPGRGRDQERREPPSRRNANASQPSRRRSERADQSPPDSRRRAQRPRRNDDQE